MNSKFYKNCAVPMCPNSTIKTPHKLFVYVPIKTNIRKKWLQLARITKLITSKNAYFCEDHFDMKNDMENYMEYHIMGSVSQILMRPNCLPTKFFCQPDRKRSTDVSRPMAAKRRREFLIEDRLKERNENQVVISQECNEENESYEVASGSTGSQQQNDYTKTDIGIQVSIRAKYRSKSSQTKLNVKHKETSPIRIFS